MTAEALIEKLRPWAASAEKQRFGEESARNLRFISSPDADYYFTAWIYDDGEAGVSARRSEAQEHEYFWSRSFELAGFDSQEELDQHLVEIVRLLLSHETQIVQIKGLINMGFELFYYVEGDWQSLGGNWGLRIGRFSFPPISGKEQVYRAPAAFASRG